MAKKINWSNQASSGGQANPAPPVGPALGQHVGVKHYGLLQQLNARPSATGWSSWVVIQVYQDTVYLHHQVSAVSILLKKAADHVRLKTQQGRAK